MEATESLKVRTYGNWRKPQSPGILGLGSLGTALLMGGLVIVVLVVMVGGLKNALITAAVLAVFLGLVLVRDSHGKNLLTRFTTRVGWLFSKSKGQNLYRSGPLGRTLWGTHQLPGLAAATRLSEHSDSYGRRFAMIYTPWTQSYTVVINCEPDGAALVDPDQIDRWVADWGQWLANLADEPKLEAASVTIETAPDSGSRLRREVRVNTDPNAPAFAKAMLNEVMDTYPSGGSSTRGYVALTFGGSSSSTGKKRKPDEVGRDLAARLPGLTSTLQATGAGATRPLAAAELCEIIRVAYSPEVSHLIDDAHAEGVPTDISWDEVGPSAAEATWDGYHHDGAWSCTWAMTSAPRGHVQSGVLTRLLSPHRDIARKRVSILFRPIDAARAAAIVEADLAAAQFRATSSKRPSARDALATRAAAATAQEEASGAGLVNFGVLVTATVLDPDQRREAMAAVDSLSATARLRLRPCYGSQDAAFAAALPLGLVLPRHLKVPSEVQDKL